MLQGKIIYRQIFVEAVNFPDILDYDKLQFYQESDSDLKLLLTATTGLKLKKLRCGPSNVSIYCEYCDTYIPPDFGRMVFNTIHNVSHPGQRQTVMRRLCKMG